MSATTMEAGRALDAVVSERAMGCKVMSVAGGKWHTGYVRDGLLFEVEGDGHSRALLPCYSTSIASAWEVVGEMRARGWLFDLSLGYDYAGAGDFWVAAFVPTNLPNQPPRSVNERAETAPLAICRAALAAIQQGSAA